MISFVKVPSDRDLTSEGAGRGRPYPIIIVIIIITSLKEGVCIHAGELFSIHTQSRKLQEMIIDLDDRNQDLHSFIIAGK